MGIGFVEALCCIRFRGSFLSVGSRKSGIRFGPICLFRSCISIPSTTATLSSGCLSIFWCWKCCILSLFGCIGRSCPHSFASAIEAVNGLGFLRIRGFWPLTRCLFSILQCIQAFCSLRRISFPKRHTAFRPHAYSS